MRARRRVGDLPGPQTPGAPYDWALEPRDLLAALAAALEGDDADLAADRFSEDRQIETWGPVVDWRPSARYLLARYGEPR